MKFFLSPSRCLALWRVLTAVLRLKRLNGGVPEGQTGGGVGIYRRSLEGRGRGRQGVDQAQRRVGRHGGGIDRVRNPLYLSARRYDRRRSKPVQHHPGPLSQPVVLPPHLRASGLCPHPGGRIGQMAHIQPEISGSRGRRAPARRVRSSATAMSTSPLTPSTTSSTGLPTMSRLRSGWLPRVRG